MTFTGHRKMHNQSDNSHISSQQRILNFYEHETLRQSHSRALKQSICFHSTVTAGRL